MANIRVPWCPTIACKPFLTCVAANLVTAIRPYREIALSGMLTFQLTAKVNTRVSLELRGFKRDSDQQTACGQYKASMYDCETGIW